MDGCFYSGFTRGLWLVRSPLYSINGNQTHNAKVPLALWHFAQGRQVRRQQERTECMRWLEPPVCDSIHRGRIKQTAMWWNGGLVIKWS